MENQINNIDSQKENKNLTIHKYKINYSPNFEKYKKINVILKPSKNSLIFFTSKNNESYIIYYLNNNNYFIIYNINTLSEISWKDNDFSTSRLIEIYYYFDKKDKRDLIIIKIKKQKDLLLNIYEFPSMIKFLTYNLSYYYMYEICIPFIYNKINENGEILDFNILIFLSTMIPKNNTIIKIINSKGSLFFEKTFASHFQIANIIQDSKYTYLFEALSDDNIKKIISYKLDPFLDYNHYKLDNLKSGFYDLHTKYNISTVTLYKNKLYLFFSINCFSLSYIFLYEFYTGNLIQQIKLNKGILLIEPFKNRYIICTTTKGEIFWYDLIINKYINIFKTPYEINEYKINHEIIKLYEPVPIIFINKLSTNFSQNSNIVTLNKNGTILLWSPY